MFPFHRKYVTSPGPTRTPSPVPRGRSRFSNKEDDDESSGSATSDYHDVYASSYDHDSYYRGKVNCVDYFERNPKGYSKLQPEKALREREKILISSIQTSLSSDYEKNDNYARLGPNKLDTFQCLKSKNGTNFLLKIEQKPEKISNSKSISSSNSLKNISDTKTKSIDYVLENSTDISDCDKNIPSILTAEALTDNNYIVSDIRKTVDNVKPCIENKNSPTMNSFFETNFCKNTTTNCNSDGCTSDVGNPDNSCDGCMCTEVTSSESKTSIGNDFNMTSFNEDGNYDIKSESYKSSKNSPLLDKEKTIKIEVKSSVVEQNTTKQNVELESEDIVITDKQNTNETEHSVVNGIEITHLTDDTEVCTVNVSLDLNDNNNYEENEQCKIKNIDKESIREYLIKHNCYNEEENISTTDNTTISSEVAKALNKLIFGSEKSKIPYQWLGQSFQFNVNSKHTKYGLTQYKAGPYGVIAAVQAYVLKALLFDPETSTVCPEPFCPTKCELNQALIRALSEILWQAGQSESAVLVTSDKKTIEDVKEAEDYELNNLCCKRYTTLINLQNEVEDKITQFTSESSNGCFLFMISVVLSSKMRNIVADMNGEDNPLIRQNGFCTLQLVMLLLTGQAVSNVFDSIQSSDPYLLRGVCKRSTIGFLSIYEHFNICQVGSNLKTPKYPIWVVNSENRFSIIFSDNRKLVSDWRAERQFHIYHHDSMKVNDEKVKLTLDTTGLYLKSKKEEEYISPLELCLQTKWKDAAISWNGSEPY